MKYSMLLLTLVVSVVLTATLAISIDGIPSAEAVKASGIKIQQYGKNAQTSICGNNLCDANPSVAQGVSSPTSVPDSTNLDMIFQRMDKIQKQHQSQMREKWSSLDSEGKIQFSQKMHRMMDKLESMNAVEHVDKMMSGDMKGSHGESYKAKEHGAMKEGHDKSGKAKEHGYMKEGDGEKDRCTEKK